MTPSGYPQNIEGCNLDPRVPNQHFLTIGSRIQSKIPHPENIDFEEFVTNVPPGISLNEFNEVSCDEVVAYMETISSSKSNFDN